VLSRIKAIILRDFNVRVDSPGQVALFAYDNNTFIVESFLPETVSANVIVGDQFSLRDMLTDESISGQEVLDWRRQKSGKKSFSIEIKPHSYRVFAMSSDQ